MPPVNCHAPDTAPAALTDLIAAGLVSHEVIGDPARLGAEAETLRALEALGSAGGEEVLAAELVGRARAEAERFAEALTRNIDTVDDFTRRGEDLAAVFCRGHVEFVVVVGCNEVR